ncbi:Nramp family divalent metal transporter [Parabacteroides chinchillae]|uniref:Manganese transport protein n=1 Tax=Parabacteroides chinchillae TaxID=871327 RepID=A0A8G2BTF0_9BACT|nr:Nramp family divalent metal transporter [Parabacteroides chinchillae]SEF39933.1 manganese transport protein [Parabacteroides chinchillae]
MNILDKLKKNHHPSSGALDLLKYIGPGLLVTVGFIDPGNWATNLAAGSEFGYALLWVVTFSSIMLIIIQHNVAHLGIVTGLCLSEATNKYLPRILSRPILGSAMLASISTSLAEILGGAIALRMLFSIPIKIGSIIVTVACIAMLLSNTYSKIERWIIMFVSIIGLSFLYELALVDVQWGEAIQGWIKPSFPDNSLLIIMSVLGAVVMPHNLFLHSEVIQSREWNLEDETVIKKQLKYEFYDTLLSMVIGWAINSAMIILAAATFFKQKVAVNELDQAQQLLVPLVGSNAGVIFAAALLLAGVSSTITSGIAGASIFAGFYGEPYNHSDLHSKLGVLLSFLPALLIIFVIGDPFKGLIISQMFLSVQLPITVFTQVYLTSNKKVMGVYANSRSTMVILLLLGAMVTILNIALLISLF